VCSLPRGTEERESSLPFRRSATRGLRTVGTSEKANGGSYSRVLSMMPRCHDGRDPPVSTTFDRHAATRRRPRALSTCSLVVENDKHRRSAPVDEADDTRILFFAEATAMRRHRRGSLTVRLPPARTPGLRRWKAQTSFCARHAEQPEQQSRCHGMRTVGTEVIVLLRRAAGSLAVSADPLRERARHRRPRVPFLSPPTLASDVPRSARRSRPPPGQGRAPPPL
jgi:hypothetical protein